MILILGLLLVDTYIMNMSEKDKDFAFQTQDCLNNDHYVIVSSLLSLKSLILQKGEPTVILSQINLVIENIEALKKSLDIFNDEEANVITLFLNNLTVIQEELKTFGSLYSGNISSIFGDLPVRIDFVTRFKGILVTYCDQVHLMLKGYSTSYREKENSSFFCSNFDLDLDLKL